jgi:plasmid stabilization system protein ParE
VKSIVHFRPDAETDVADAAAWYETQKAGLGAEFLDEIQSTCSGIAEHPEIYPLVHRKARRAVIHKFRLGFITESEMD